MTKTTSPLKAPRAPVCIRLSDAERKQLRSDAAKHDLTVSAYIRERLFSDDRPVGLLPDATRRKLLAQILSAIGRAGYAKSLRDIADAGNTGLLTLTPELEAEILAACGHISDMHITLLRGLGLRPEIRP